MTANKSRSKHILITGILVSLFVIIVGVLYIGLKLDQSKIPSSIVGKVAYPFSATWIQGQEFLPAAKERRSFRLQDFRGKKVVLNFWASWCVSCRQEAHELEAFWRKHQRDDTLVVGIAIQDTQEEAKKFAKHFGKTYILGLDDTGQISIDYGVTGVPETFIINENGVVIHKEVGPVTKKMLIELLPKFNRKKG